ncbi:MAG: glycosyltransferase family 2 protein [Candidatus Omnitrophota bacterium]
MISIITPSLNQARFIETAIRSIAEQGSQTVEHLVIDGASTDGTVAILKKHPRLGWVSEPDQGPADALNKGFSKARGDILGWLNADDYYEPGALRAVERIFEKEPDTSVLIGRARVIDEEGKPLFLQEEPSAAGFTFEGMLKYWKYDVLPQPAIFFRRRVADSLGPLDTGLCYFDYDYFLRMRQYFAFRRIPDVLVNIRFHPEAISVRDFFSGQRRKKLLAASRRHWGRPASFFYWKIAASYYFHLPRSLWKSHYEKFALRHKGTLKKLFRENPFLSFCWKARGIILRHPFCATAAACGKLFRKNDGKNANE